MPTRRDILKSLTMTAVAGSVLRVIPLEAAEYAHRMVTAEKAAAKTYAPKFFSAHDYKTLQTLCQTIIPADAETGGAIEAGAPEFIDLITSEIGISCLGYIGNKYLMDFPGCPPVPEA